MKDQVLTLQYQNEDDRAYGLAGMAISLAALDALDRVAEVSLDSTGPMVTFSNQFYFSGSPSISPKATWQNLVENFKITAAMAVSNVMSRSMVRLGNEIPMEILSDLKQAIAEEGRSSCDLEDDELENLFGRTLNYTYRIFGNRRLHPAIAEFSRILSVRRRLSGMEIADELHSLQLI